MAASDALVVVEDWVSEHYFTTDATNESFHKRVLERRKAWDAAGAEGQDTTRSRYGDLHAQITRRFVQLYDRRDQAPVDRDQVAALTNDLLTLLGYRSAGLSVQHEGPVRLLGNPGSQKHDLAIIEAMPVEALEDVFAGDAHLLTPWAPDGEQPITNPSRLVSKLLIADDGPEFALVLAGRWLVVADAGRWPEGRYLGVDLQTVFERNDTKRAGEVDKALTCLDAESLAPDADGRIWWSEVIEDSVKHTVGVSKDLREGVRRSIEIIANEVVIRRHDLGLDPLPQSQAQPLAQQSLRFLYRILFLLYAEASPELGVLPTGAAEYDNGYSLDRLRELVQVPLTSTTSQNGTHLYNSLGVLFRLVDQGHVPARAGSSDDPGDALVFHPLRADLFRPQATALIDEVELGNQALQQVLERLLLSKQQKGRDRGFISYVDLGINQLGAVYEGLMSYTGSFAETDLYEVARGGDASKGSWVVPVDRAHDINGSDFVCEKDAETGEAKPIIHRQGSFVFRLSGRERQQSASYYTPEVLTRFTVGQALEELLDQDGTTTPADDILQLTICEPALGSGAFAIEAVRQLAEQYLKRKQAETGEQIEPENYAAELQKVKAAIALHQVHGVDLNALAVEFAEITLWLDTMAAGLEAPWFGLHLRRGNSLIGARHAVYTAGDVADKKWLKQAPIDVPLTDIAERVATESSTDTAAMGRVPHWLLPADGWGATADSKEAKQLVPDRVAAVKKWRTSVKAKPSKRQVEQLVELGRQAEELWTMAYRRLLVAEQQTRRPIAVWGQPVEQSTAVVTREQIEESLADPNGAYQRLRRVMDAWCALWFWPLTGDEIEPPSLTQWLDAATALLGVDVKKTVAKKRAQGQDLLSPTDIWQALADDEGYYLSATNARPVQDVLAAYPWLGVCERVAQQQGFFHWQLDFATVFGRGGFDLQVGNPPWVRPDSDVDAALAEFDPWWQLVDKPSEAQRRSRRALTLDQPGAVAYASQLDADIVALRTFVAAPENFPVLAGLRPDLYRCFMSQVWDHASALGIASLLHPETHFTDDKAKRLRNATYLRLRRHWQFKNELMLFSDIDDQVVYGVHIYGKIYVRPDFLTASALYHPETVISSINHNGEGEPPGFKHQGRWDQRPHAQRIERVTDETLATWRDVLEADLPNPRETRMLYTVNREVAETLATLSTAQRLGSLGLQFSAGWNETTDRRAGYFEQEWGPATWDQAILQGPHLHVATPLYKSPNRTMKHNQDWAATDFEALASDALPVTAYQPIPSASGYKLARGRIFDNDPISSKAARLAWRSMAANTGERTLIAALVPRSAGHINNVRSITMNQVVDLVRAATIMASLLSDFTIRSAPRAHILLAEAERLALPRLDHPLWDACYLRILRLNCVTDAYADLWSECWDPAFAVDSWTASEHTTAVLGDVTSEWTTATPLRRAADRRQALVEIDALVALMLGVTADELCTVYRTQFAVLYGYDHNEYTYDANGRLVPNKVLTAWRKKGDRIPLEERTHTNESGNTYVYELPFENYDREHDIRVAYAEFERRLAVMEDFDVQTQASTRSAHSANGDQAASTRSARSADGDQTASTRSARSADEGDRA